MFSINFDDIKNLWNNCQFCKKYKYWIIIILLIIFLPLIYWVQKNYKIFDEYLGKRDKLIITFTN